MKNRFLLMCFCVFFTSQLFAQETFTYANPNRDFFEGKEFFAQRKYSASLTFFEKFLEKAKDEKSDMLQEASFFVACDAYELRKESAEKLLQSYLKRFPYTQFEDNVNLMLGNLAFEKKQYNLALTYYQKTDEKRLSSSDAADLVFRKGYSYVENGDFAKAKPFFKSLKGKKSKYENAAAYYSAYADYSLKNYDAALDGFLAIQSQPEYSGFVPYYIIQIYYLKKDYTTLIPYAEKTLAANPNNQNNVEVYRILGECSYQNNDFDKTVSYLSKYAKASGKAQRNDMYILGVSYYKIGDYPSSTQYLSKVTTTKDSLSQNAYLHLGYGFVKQDKKNNARMAFRSASEMDFDAKTKEEAAYNYTLSTFETTTPFGESIKAFEKFLSDYPNSEYKDKISENLITAYMSSKNFEAANASLEKMKRLSPAMKDVKAYILFQLGTESYVKGEYASAIEQFTNALKIATDNYKSAQVYYWRAESYYKLEDYDNSRKDYQSFFSHKGATDFPDYNLANYGVGYTYFQQKQYKESLPLFLKYIDNEKDTKVPNYSDALDRVGDCYFSAKDLANAEKYYTKAIAEGGKDEDYAVFQKAFVQGLRKNYTGKISGLQKLIAAYPKSSYLDDSYYELARAYVLTENHEKAIETYQTLIQKFPQTPLARKASIEIGMLYDNLGKSDEAISSYKQVVANYPNSVETKTALESMEALYVEQNKVAEYIAYTKNLGEGIVVSNPSREDSLTFLAAERLYMKSNYIAATSALENYLESYCPNGHSCLTARYYLADCYYATNKLTKALEEYKTLSQMQGNSYMETVLVRLSQIAYDSKDYQTALESFKQLMQIAQEPENIQAAKIGVLRCSYLINDVSSTIQIATEILEAKSKSADLEREARFYLAKAYIQTGQSDKAANDLKLLSKDLRTPSGAESKYLLADYYFVSGNDKKSEEEVTDFITKGTPHQYWLARAFVLLADIYIKRGDDFQAKQYLLSLQSNYPTKDSIQDLIQERLDGIQERESKSIIQ